MTNIKKTDFAKTIKENMEVYAHEVNENRAIPSIYDSLKPVQRRALFGLQELKATSDKDFKGSAEAVGYILGHFHPHGDSSVYEAIVRLAQPLIMLLPLIDFHGAVGSLIDPPAAMRYTGCKLSDYGMSIIQDSGVPGVIEYKKNYNDLYDEPRYFNGPMATLNLLINPQLGIGVGLASNFTCHAPKDVLAALKYRMEYPACSIDELLQVAPLRPSYPKCGKIINPSNIPAIYKTGKGTVILQANYKWEKEFLLIEELPYRVDASEVKKKIVNLMDDGKFDDVSEVFEERGKLKIYCKPKNKEEFITRLFKNTSLQNQYHINMMATDLTGKPHLYTLLEILDVHIQLQHNRLVQKATYYGTKYQQELHLQEGLLKALSDVDTIITLIKSAQNSPEAKLKLQTYLQIDAEQAQAILDIKLSRLTHMEIEQIKEKIISLANQIEEQKEIVSSSETRNALYFSEIEAISFPNYLPTECVDLISLNKDEGKADKSFWFTEDTNGYVASYDDQGEKSFSLTDEVIIITNKMRGFRRKSTDFLMGDIKWDSFLKLTDEESVLGSIKITDLDDIEMIEFIDTENKSHIVHKSFLLLGASTRGKKMIKEKYQAVSYNIIKG